MPEFQFDSFADFVGMGGYAFYVWMAYAFFTLVMGWNLVLPFIQRKKVIKLLRARMQREAAQSGQMGKGG